MIVRCIYWGKVRVKTILTSVSNNKKEACVLVQVYAKILLTTLVYDAALTRAALYVREPQIILDSRGFY